MKNELLIYDGVGEWGVTAKDVTTRLEEIGDVDTLHVRINSLGGSVFEGIAIYSALSRHPARVVVHIDGIAASIASYIAMAGDERLIAADGFVMIHNPFMFADGEAADLRKMAELLESLERTLAETYADRAGLAVEQVLEMMADTAWLDGEQAVEFGFATGIDADAPLAAAAAIKPTDAPEWVVERLQASADGAQNEETEMSENALPTVDEIKAACPGASSDFVVDQLSSGHDINQVKDDWIAQQALDLEQVKDEAKAKAKEAAEAKAKADRIAASGVDPIPAADVDGKPAASGGTPAASGYKTAIAEHIAAGMRRHEAVAKVCREQPELRDAYVADHNARHPHGAGGRR